MSGRRGGGGRSPGRRPERRGSGGGARRGRSGPGAQRGGDRSKRSEPPRPTGRSSRPPERGLGGTQVEGRQAVRELLLAGRRRVREILLSDEVERVDVVADIVELAADAHVPLRSVSRRTLDAEARSHSSQGVVARADALTDHGLDDLLGAASAPFLLALDGITDPQNLGALLRSAECAGVDGVVLPRHRAVHVTPSVTKAAAGAVEYVPMSVVGGLPTAISRVRDAGIRVVGLDAGGEGSIYDVDLGPGGICLVLGAEGAGLSRLVRRRCDAVASIPLAGQLASLNVSVAGALGLFEVVRRHRG